MTTASETIPKAFLGELRDSYICIESENIGIDILSTVLAADVDYVVVKKKGRICGVTSASDVVLRYDGKIESCLPAFSTVMSEDASWAQASAMFGEDACRFAVVIGQQGHVLGVLTAANFMKHLVQHTADLEAELAVSKTAHRTKNQFLANLSHEVRSPMASILGYASLLLDCPIGDNEKNLVRTIQRNGRHLIEVFNDLLDLSKIEAGHLEINFQTVEPDRIISDIHSLMKVRADEKEIQLDFEFPTLVPKAITADPTRLRQVLINLIGNAIKFTDSGTVTIRTSYRADCAPAELRIDIVDTGVGISADEQRLLFEPYSQVGSQKRQHSEGTGLGLSISKKLAELMGGRLECSSKPGCGSTFSLVLEIPDTQQVRLVTPRRDINRSNRDHLPASGLAGCHVLVVDDRHDIRFLLQQVLQHAGAQVVLAENGQTALELLIGETKKAPRPFDIVLLDMQMPTLDGFATARQLRGHGDRTPIIALTAGAMDDDREKCLAAGCNCYVSKPIVIWGFKEVP